MIGTGTQLLEFLPPPRREVAVQVDALLVAIHADLDAVVVDQPALRDHAPVLTAGLDRFDRTTGVFTHYRNNPADPKSISDNRIYALCEDRQGDLWVGTNGGGLSRLNRKNGTFTTYRHDDKRAGSLGESSSAGLSSRRNGDV